MPTDFYDDLAEERFIMMKKGYYSIFFFFFFKLILIDSIRQNGTGFKIK